MKVKYFWVTWNEKSLIYQANYALFAKTFFRVKKNDQKIGMR
jgi:hypothetical protein